MIKYLARLFLSRCTFFSQIILGVRARDRARVAVSVKPNMHPILYGSIVPQFHLRSIPILHY